MKKPVSELEAEYIALGKDLEELKINYEIAKSYRAFYIFDLSVEVLGEECQEFDEVATEYNEKGHWAMLLHISITNEKLRHGNNELV